MNNKSEANTAAFKEQEENKTKTLREDSTQVNTDNSPSNETADLLNNLKEAKKDILLAQAENENLRKRMQRQIEESHKFAVTIFAKDVVGTLDDLYRAIDNIKSTQNTDESFQALRKGVELTRSNFEKSLEKHGIKRLDPKNEKFDYKFHEALSQVVTEDHQEDTIISVVQAGYSIKDKMLKHAQVIVAVSKK